MEEPTMELPSIPLRTSTKNNRRVLDSAISEELAQAVQKFNVCGMVVSWPVQREGWCGKSCGKVLHTLDQIQAVAQRPVCLYDPEHSTPPEDEWGRAALYSETSDKTLHVASEEQYEQDRTVGKVAADIWNDFCAEHWPELCQYRQEPIQVSMPQSNTSPAALYKDEDMYASRLHAAF
jgi:RNase H-fold protein (predicted Holliday junction resolvase)